MAKNVSRTIVLADLHYPEHDQPSWDAVQNYLKYNDVDQLIFLGDNLDCQQVSRHTVGKPRLRRRGGYFKDIEGFKLDILKPLDKLLKGSCKKVFFMGNHEDWMEDYLDENPELEGALGIADNLELKERGWKVVPCGGIHEVGRIALVHGDQVGANVYVAKKLVDTFCQTSIMGHVHTFSTFTKTSVIKARSKWLGITLPCLCTLAPNYSKGRNNSWLNGFGVIESWGEGFGNIYVPIIINGKFSFGGHIYGKDKKL